MIFKRNQKQHILAIIVAFAVAFPAIALPLGIRKGIAPVLAVSKAYKAIMGADEPSGNIEEAEVEDWALEGEGQSGGDALIDNAVEGDAVVDDLENTKFSDVPKFVVYQNYDQDNLPEELLDPQFFTPDNKLYYIKARNSILKEHPVMDSKTIRQLPVGLGVERTGIGDTWSRIKTKEGEEGYVLTSTITDQMVWQAIDRTIWVDTDSLIVRKEPSTKSEMVEIVNDEDRLVASSVSDKWYKVTTPSGKVGYVYISYTTTKAPPTPTPTPVPVVRTNNGGGSSSSNGGSGGGTGRTGNLNSLPRITGKNGQSAVNIAASLLGTRYVYGGASRSGIDCSGLVMYCYAQLHISLPHGANAICNSYGVSVSRADLRVGDVICYDYGDHCGHVALYAGGGRVIHASQSKGRVLYGNLDMMKIRRIKRMIR